MPGPGAHLLTSLGASCTFAHLSEGRFSERHALVFALNSFVGPDIGSCFEWLTNGVHPALAGAVMSAVHHPVHYAVILGLPLAYLYRQLTRKTWPWEARLTQQQAPGLSFRQCLLLVIAGELNHFALDVPFEENGESGMMSWILSTGWFHGEAPIDAAAAFVIGTLCCLLVAGYLYINRSPSLSTSAAKRQKAVQSAVLLTVFISLYSLWCYYRVYLTKPRAPALGEEADLGILVYVVSFWLLPFALCAASVPAKALQPTVLSDTEGTLETDV
ncbi:hypothetical protein WJX72_012383 [[Myrmecia] bisecta]|uniref:Uncharacterized protein n=1 Tax=[Myrmecia] bisecta TaxID=41462 RepID=A0AAW1PTH5_9CHLO